MKPSNVLILVLVIAAIVAVFSYNAWLAVFLILLLIAAVATKLLRSYLGPPGG